MTNRESASSAGKVGDDLLFGNRQATSALLPENRPPEELARSACSLSIAASRSLVNPSLAAIFTRSAREFAFICGIGLERGGEVPWQELTNSIDRLFSDARQDGAEVERWIEAVELSSADQSVERSRALPARIGTEEQIVLPSDRDGPQRPLGRAIVNLQKAVIDVSSERPPVRQCISDGAGGVALGGEGPQHLLHPSPEVIEHRSGLGLANGAAEISRLSANLLFDCVEYADAVESFCGDRRTMRDMDIVELAPGVSPTSYFVDPSIAVKAM